MADCHFTIDLEGGSGGIYMYTVRHTCDGFSNVVGAGLARNGNRITWSYDGHD